MGVLILPTFQSGSVGVRTVAADVTDGPVTAGFSGAAGAISGATGTGLAYTLGDIVLIHQTMGAGANQCEINRVASYNSATGAITFTNPLLYTYSSSGNDKAQIMVFPDHSSFTLNAGINLYASGWNGSTAGIWGIFSNGIATINGNIVMDSRGFRGGAGRGGDQEGFCGEGTGGPSVIDVNAANGNGGGAGGWSSNSPWDQGNGAGGGSNGTSGEGGWGTGGGNNAGGPPGSPGSVVGNADILSGFSLGGGGGGGGDSGGAGGNGGGAVFIIAKKIVLGASARIFTRGGGGTAEPYTEGCGGSGAGGSVLLVCEELVWTAGAEIHASGGPHVRNTNHPTVDGDSDGGFGGAGRIAISACRITGTPATNPAYVNNGYQKFCGRVGTL